jgi:hypothetical protein
LYQRRSEPIGPSSGDEQRLLAEDLVLPDLDVVLEPVLQVLDVLTDPALGLLAITADHLDGDGHAQIQAVLVDGRVRDQHVVLTAAAHAHEQSSRAVVGRAEPNWSTFWPSEEGADPCRLRGGMAVDVEARTRRSRSLCTRGKCVLSAMFSTISRGWVLMKYCAVAPGSQFVESSSVMRDVEAAAGCLPGRGARAPRRSLP